MKSPRLSLKTALRFGAALTSLILAAGLCGPVHAQVAEADAPVVTRPLPQPSVLSRAPTRTAEALRALGETQKGDDGLNADGAFISADQVTSEDEDTILARGQVEMRYEGRLIRADEVRYNQKTGYIVATGNIQSINPDGSVQYADRLEFDEAAQTGTGERIASISPDNSKLFAGKVERVDENTNELSQVIFTPCELCVKDGKTQEPVWSIQAGKIVQNKNRRMVYYRNAVLKARGVPVFYTPILWHADPDMERASGFLMARPSNSKRRGLSLELPYLWAVSPYTDIVISPQFNQKVNPFLNMEVSHRFHSGHINSRFGVTHEAYFNNRGERYDDKTTRGYVLADGAFTINSQWRWNFTGRHVFDKAEDDRPYANLFDRYNISDGFPEVGEFRAGSRQFINQINLIRQTPTAYAALSVLSFQSLRIQLDPGADPERLTAEIGKTMPVIAPMVEAYWSPDAQVLGGRTSFSASGVSIRRFTRPDVDIAQGATSDVDSARLSVGANWRRDMLTPVGIKVAPFLETRHDEYRIAEYDTSGETHRISRTLGTAGVDLSYPLIRKFSGLTAIIEPVAQLAISPDSQVEPYLTNEDSLVFEFDPTTLFKANKSPGFDLYEGGERLSVGVKSRLKFDSGYSLTTLVGRTFRTEDEPIYLQRYNTSSGTDYYDPSGLAGKRSDWIVQAEFETPFGLRGYNRYRLDSDSGEVRRGETGLSYAGPRTLATFRYVVDNTSPYGPDERLNNTAYENFQLTGEHFFTANWGVSTRLNRDLNQGKWARSEIALIYRDDCTRLEVVYERDETLIGSSQNDALSTIFFRFSLATLTTSDSGFTDFR